jgi:hypothetical protein
MLHDLGSDISSFRTWAWRTDNPVGTGEPRYDDEFIDACMRSAIERELARNGFTQTGGGPADFLVGYRIDIDRTVEAGTNYDPGDVSLIVWDTSDREVAWAATVHGQIVRVRPREERRALIDEGVRLLLLEFRPLGEGESARRARHVGR